MKLYGYWRSSAAFRVRIACHYKGLPFEYIAVNLTKEGGEQHLPGYTILNPNRLVPTLVDGDMILNQSLAIIEYLDEAYPDKPLLPACPLDRAKVRALALNLVCDCQPLNNLRVMKYLGNELKQGKAQKEAWFRHWHRLALAGLEAQLEGTARRFCFGDQPTLADVCLVPQCYQAERVGLSLEEFPRIQRIVSRCRELEAFNLAAPERQPDAIVSN
ncbi:maleylacetoacetate isomerase [Ferrimonas marina]|uniref:maleylacetoacetate isomerase n=1 Tax=Ferrimonas marina TaxID=299255 RepID=UPI000830FC3D|nr:maleylacetoacetate isomerase [Ferrimonas marina]